MLDYLLSNNIREWDRLVETYETQAKSLKVPTENNPQTLARFNWAIEDLFSRAIFDYNRARTNHDAIKRFLKTVLEDAYTGNNDLTRKAAGIQRARAYPAPEFYHQPFVNLFELEMQFSYHYYMMEGVVKSIEAKQAAKVTNNSLLKMEKEV